MVGQSEERDGDKGRKTELYVSYEQCAAKDCKIGYRELCVLELS